MLEVREGGRVQRARGQGAATAWTSCPPPCSEQRGDGWGMAGWLGKGGDVLWRH